MKNWGGDSVSSEEETAGASDKGLDPTKEMLVDGGDQRSTWYKPNINPLGINGVSTELQAGIAAAALLRDTRVVLLGETHDMWAKSATIVTGLLDHDVIGEGDILALEQPPPLKGGRVVSAALGASALHNPWKARIPPMPDGAPQDGWVTSGYGDVLRSVKGTGGSAGSPTTDPNSYMQVYSDLITTARTRGLTVVFADTGRTLLTSLRHKNFNDTTPAGLARRNQSTVNTLHTHLAAGTGLPKRLPPRLVYVCGARHLDATHCERGKSLQQCFADLGYSFAASIAVDLSALM